MLKEVTGVQRFAREMVRELIKAGHNIVILCPSGEIVYDEIIDIKHVIRLPFGQGVFWEQVTLAIYLTFNRIDNLINFCNSAPLFYKFNCVFLHDVIFLKFPKSYPLGMRLFYKAALKHVARKARILCTVSNYSKIEISNAFQVSLSRINVIPNAVPSIFLSTHQIDSGDALKFPFDLQPGVKVFAVISSFDANKNLQNLILAFKGVKDQNVLMLLIGNHVEKNLPLLNEALLDPRIKYVGRVTDNDLIRLYRASWYFIIPSILEGFGIPPLEAQACGCPVLSSFTSSLPEVLGDSALYFDPQSVESIRATIEKSLTSEEYRSNLVNLGYQNIMKFNFSRSASELYKLL